MQGIDEIDKKLLFELQKDCKQSTKQLAEKVNLSITPVHERIKKLESTGIIQAYCAQLNPDMLGKKLLVYCQVILTKHKKDLFVEFEESIKNMDEVLEAAYIGGDYDFLLKLLVNDVQDYQEFVVNKISKLDIISNIKSSFVIKTIKKSTVISL